MTRKTPKPKTPAKVARKTARKPKATKKNTKTPVKKATKKGAAKQPTRPIHCTSVTTGLSRRSSDTQSNSAEPSVTVVPVSKQEALDLLDDIEKQTASMSLKSTKPLSNAQKVTQQILENNRKPSKPVVEVQINQTKKLSKVITEATESITKGFALASTSLANKLKSKSVQHEDNAPHLIIEARAGTGKTTTLIEGLKRIKGLPSDLIPSPQQAAIWESMELSKGAKTVCFAAFNKSIAAELKNRVPLGCDAMTMHGLGYRAIRNAFPNLGAPNSYRVQDIICELLEEDIRVLRAKKPTLLKATEELVGLCKMNMVEMDGHCEPYPAGELDWVGTLQNIASHYDIDVNGQSEEAFALVSRVLERCKDVAKDNCIDFNDMIYLPVTLNLPVFKYDLLLIDESQDLNKAQQMLTKMAGKRLIYCGDPLQAIYGWAGADSQSMSRLEAELKQTERGCLHLPLTVTRRCGKAIVREAQKYVPDFEAFETNPEGKVGHATFKCDSLYPGAHWSSGAPVCSYHDLVLPGDMVLCRCNAPLVGECFRFIRQGRKANIQGIDVGTGLIKTIKKIFGIKEGDSLACYSAVQLIAGVDTWLHEETKRENAKRNPDEAKIIGLQDRHDCILAFTDGQQTAAQVVTKIESLFTDDKSSQCIRLSSIHRAKGLEAKRVFFICTKEAPCPHPMAKTAWQRAEEEHLCYVGITRAIEELIWVTG